MKILVVEDSAILRQSMKKLIEEIGHSTLFANSGEEALQMVGIIDFDLVIMDVEMPGLDGFETTTLMREAFDTRWIPIIFATGHAGDDNVLSGIRAGGDDYLIKPLSKKLLEAKLIAMNRIAKMQNQLTRLNSELAALNQYDSLTQILNRHTFIEKASQSLLEAKRSAHPTALLMLDVDFFKHYNDHYGHVSGDECLKQVAKSIQGTLKRESDLVARYGGEEFIAILPQTDQIGAVKVAQDIIDDLYQLSIPHNSSSVSDCVTISVGVSVGLSSSKSTLDNLILEADRNLYTAKSEGRNRLASTNQLHQSILIADDNEMHINKLTEILQPLGYVITTDNKQETIELAIDIIPNLILLSNQSTQVEAQAIQTELKNHVRTAAIPVLLVSSAIDAGNTGNYLNLIDQDPDELLDRVTHLLEDN
jgi:diguanylate cyclase (GGDEF)-like protein